VHPRFFGWAQGTGNAAALLAELVAATMNSNCGGRDHGAVYVERDVIRWTARSLGLPDTASGVLVTGTSQATVLALAAARVHALGIESRGAGLAGGPRLTLYATGATHNAVAKAAELLGLGSAAVRAVPLDPQTDGMDMKALEQRVARDRKTGERPFCVVGTAGSVDRGSYDPLAEMARFCADEGLWLHVDGAFGAWTRIAPPPWNQLADGIELADSVALDFHKWMFVQYDCGLVLIRDEARHRAAFAARPAYLAPQTAGLGGGDPWFCDYGIDLSRGFRALKVWATLRSYGRERLGQVIGDNCRLAARMGQLVEQAPELRLEAPVRSNVCCFGADLPDGADPGPLNAAIAQRLQLDGDAVFSTTTVGGRTVIRGAIVNHRTQGADVEAAIVAARAACRELAAR
jgi:glutamate/tyrosine decarboxylase-like PLP-dependent enzyme